MNKKIIYDFGANTGDDLAYYLKKADVVVAIEANPSLTKEIEKKYQKPISEKRLFVENCVITNSEHSGIVPFYLHKYGHIISQFPKPAPEEIDNFDEVMLPSKTVHSIIDQYGAPYYIKIDIEGYDHEILRALFERKIFPEYLSAESHNIEVFALLVACGQYKSFNLVDGPSIARHYGNCNIHTNAGTETFSFPGHSAGPFGEDLTSPWMTANSFFELLALEKLGWKDIHVTKKSLADPNARVHFKNYAWSYVLNKITPKFLRPFFAGLIIQLTK